MTVAFNVQVKGGDELVAALNRIDISENPGLFEPVFLRWAISGVSISKEDYLSGPRPQRLGVVTNRLRSSVNFNRFQPARGGSIEFGTNVEYGPAHEFGRPEVNLPARPFIRPAAEEAARDIPDDLVKLWRSLL